METTMNTLASYNSLVLLFSLTLKIGHIFCCSVNCITLIFKTQPELEGATKKTGGSTASDSGGAQFTIRTCRTLGGN